MPEVRGSGRVDLPNSRGQGRQPRGTNPRPGVLPRECIGHKNTLFQNTREDSTHGHHQMANTEIRLIIFFAAKDGEALYSQQKQDRELTVAQIMNSLLPNSDLN